MATAVSVCPPTCCRPSATTLVPTPMSASTNRVVSSSTPTGPEEVELPHQPPTTFKQSKSGLHLWYSPDFFLSCDAYHSPSTTIPSRHEKNTKHPTHPGRPTYGLMPPSKRSYCVETCTQSRHQALRTSGYGAHGRPCLRAL